MRPISRDFSLQLLLDALAERLPGVLIASYTGESAGPRESHAVISINSPGAFIQLIRAPRGLGLARAWVTGTIDITGDLHEIVRRESQLRDPKLYALILATAVRLTPSFRFHHIRGSGATRIEYRYPRPGRHSISRDIIETEYHYGRSLEFYRNLLGASLAYSCAIFSSSSQTLDAAQANKHELICQKLNVSNESTILDIGCGWGSLLRYAIQHYSCKARGITASREQYMALRSDPELVRTELEIVHGDYRQCLPARGVTTAASVGVYEHVGAKHSQQFFSLIRASLQPGARYLNQCIVRTEDGPKHFRRNSFTQRYIFPNAQLLPLSVQIRDLERTGFQVLSVTLHGQSYEQTLRCWIDNLTAKWGACVDLEGEQSVRAWYMYLTGALTRFESRAIDVAQVLAQAR